MSFEIISYITSVITGEEKRNVKEINSQEEIVDTSSKRFGEMKISNQAIENMLNEDDEGKPKSKKILNCTKCKGSEFYDQESLRKHFKSNWHNFNAKQSAKGLESFSAEEYDEFILMNPQYLEK